MKQFKKIFQFMQRKGYNKLMLLTKINKMKISVAPFLILTLGIGLLISIAVNTIETRKIDGLEKENIGLITRIEEVNKNNENNQNSKNQYKSCDGTNHCNQVVENLNTLVGIYTSRFLELTFKLGLPSDWIISSWSGNGYGFSIGTKTNPIIANIIPYSGVSERVQCLQNPEMQPGLSDKEKYLFEKYKTFETSFGTLKLSRTNPNYKGYSYYEPTYVICQEVYQGYPVFITDTSIGVINLPVYPDKVEEVEKFISILKNIKVTKKVLKL